MSIENPENKKDPKLEAFHNEIRRLIQKDIDAGIGNFEFIPENKNREIKPFDKKEFDPEKLTYEDMEFYEKYKKGELTLQEVIDRRDEVLKSGDEDRGYFMGYLVSKLQEHFF